MGSVLGALGQRSGLVLSCWLAIVNPCSGGNGTSARLGHRAERPQRIAARTVFTEYPGHAAQLAREATDYGGVAVVGGDGTLFEILNRLDLNQQRFWHSTCPYLGRNYLLAMFP